MEIEAAQQLRDVILKLENLLVIMAVWSLMKAYSKAFPEFNQKGIVKKVRVFAPLALATGAMWLPRAAAEDLLIGDKIILGLVLGGFEVVGHDVWKKWRGK